MKLNQLMELLSAFPKAMTEEEIVSISSDAQGYILLELKGEAGVKKITLTSLSQPSSVHSVDKSTSFEKYAYAMYLADHEEDDAADFESEIKSNRVFYMKAYCLKLLTGLIWDAYCDSNEDPEMHIYEDLKINEDELCAIEMVVPPKEKVQLTESFVSDVLDRAFKVYNRILNEFDGDIVDELETTLCYDFGVDASILEEYSALTSITEKEFRNRCEAIESTAQNKGFSVWSNFIDKDHLDVLWYDALDVVAEICYAGYNISFIVEGDSFGYVRDCWGNDTEFCSGLDETALGNRIQCDSVLKGMEKDRRVFAELQPQVFIYIGKEGEKPEEYEGYVCDNVLSCLEDNLDLVLNYIDNKEKNAKIRRICQCYGADYQNDIGGNGIADFDHCNAFWYDQKDIVTVKYHGYTVAYDVCGEIRAQYADEDIRKVDGGTSLIHNAGVMNILKNDAVLESLEDDGKLTIIDRNWVNIVILGKDGFPVSEPEAGSYSNVLDCVLDTLEVYFDYIDNQLSVPGGTLPYAELRKRYYSHSGRCGRCGVLMLSKNGHLGDLYAISKQGDFYCTNCKSISQHEEGLFCPSELLRSDNITLSTSPSDKKNDSSFTVQASWLIRKLYELAEEKGEKEKTLYEFLSTYTWKEATKLKGLVNKEKPLC